MQGQSLAVARRAAGEGRLDRLAGAGEDGEDAVAEELAFDGRAGVIADEGAKGADEVAGLLTEGGVAEAFRQPRGIGNIGEEDEGGARGHDGLLRSLALLKELHYEAHRFFVFVRYA